MLTLASFACVSSISLNNNSVVPAGGMCYDNTPGFKSRMHAKLDFVYVVVRAITLYIVFKTFLLHCLSGIKNHTEYFVENVSFFHIFQF